jgi:hypothetical protein
MARRARVLLTAALLAISATTAAAQSGVDQVVALDQFKAPLTITAVTPTTIGSLAQAAGVPMGVEILAPSAARPWKVQASGRSLRAVLDDIISADGRYGWREDDGVVVIRPVSAWADESDVLHRSVGSLRLTRADGNDALVAINEFFGATPLRGSGPPDTRTFDVALPSGRLLDTLNGIVRAHGTMVWAIHPTGSSRILPLTVSLVVGSSSIGFGFRSDVAIKRVSYEGPRRFRSEPSVPVLDRIVGKRRTGDLVVLRSVRDLADVAAAVEVPLGLELLPPQAAPNPPQAITVTGLPLRIALGALADVDARYEWREMDGVIVVRPRTAWSDPENRLSSPVSHVRLEQVTTSEAIRRVLTLLGSEQRLASVPDTRPVSVDIASGTILDLLSAVARSHGALSWRFQEVDPAESLSHSSGYLLLLEFFSGNGTTITIR